MDITKDLNCKMNHVPSSIFQYYHLFIDNFRQLAIQPI